MKNIDILFQYGNREFLHKFSKQSLRESIQGNDITYQFVALDCTELTIGQGFNKLVEAVKTNYVIWTPDDFAYFPNGDWIEKAVKILENDSQVGIIELRKERDGESPWSIDERRFIGNMSYYIIHSWDNRCFNLTPFMMRTEDLKKIVPLDENDKTGNTAEASGYEKFKKLGLKKARLDIDHLGVCFHLGWKRSRYFGWEYK